VLQRSRSLYHKVRDEGSGAVRPSSPSLYLDVFLPPSPSDADRKEAGAGVFRTKDLAVASIHGYHLRRKMRVRVCVCCVCVCNLRYPHSRLFSFQMDIKKDNPSRASEILNTILPDRSSEC
jgi:hypothetical protein